MFFVVILHNLYYGNLLNHGGLTGASWMSAWLIESLASVAVNLFAMITGYLSIGRSFKSSRVVEVVLQAVFWAWVCLLVSVLMGIKLPKMAVISWLLPVKQFWYVNSYIGLMFLTPILQKGIRQLKQKQFAALLVVLLAVSGTFGFIGVFDLNNGYSAYWLVVMYLTGAYLKLYPVRFRDKRVLLFGIYLGTAVLSTIMEYSLQVHRDDPFALIHYISPLTILGSIALFILLSQMRINARWAKRLLKFFAPISFGVYLIDSFVLTLPDFGQSFINAGRQGIALMVVRVLGGSLIMFGLFAVADEGRLLLFRGLKVRKLLVRFDRRIKDWLYWLSARL